MSPALRAARTVALVAIAVLILAASAASFAESFRGLYLWATGHGLRGNWAYVWPLQLDVFIATGELALLVGLTDRWAKRDRIGAWVVTGLGAAASVAANVGHVATTDWTSRMTAAVPPLAAAAALAVGLGVLKRVVGMAAVPEPALSVAIDAPAAAQPAASGPVVVDPVAAVTGVPGAQSHRTGSRQRGNRKRANQHSTMPRAAQDAAVLSHLTIEPGLSKAVLARRTGLSVRAISRAMERLSTPAAGTT